MPRKRPTTRTIMAPIPPIPPTAIGMPPPPRRSSMFSLSRSPIHRMATLDTELQYLITPAKDCVIKHQHDERSDNRSDYAKSNVEKETLTGLVDNLAPYEPGDQAEYDPANDRHLIPFPP